MLRWHASSCTEPLVSIEGSKVYCQSCYATYLFDPKSVPPGTTASLDIPEDRPLGQLRLRWPPAVPYTSDKELGNAHYLGETVHDLEIRVISSERSPQNGAQSAIYSQLGAGEFRLIRLDSSKSQSDLIHVDIETYDLDDCPEYEATSYAWAGEDGDSKLSGPIFIGSFYDVAWQTSNCLSLLRYLRPGRGIRMVWVDAICINQANAHERGMQVAKMRDIYRNASRVVVYLGPDTVQHSMQQHRPRARLDELDGNGENHAQKIHELLNRRYFSRVWVIQELVLAKSLVIPLHDSDYHADNTCIERLKVDWNDTKASWFQHGAGGRVFSLDRLDELLDQTWASEASDPRDKLFGILGLVDTAVCAHKAQATDKPHSKLDYSLLPNYTLSVKETFIGLAAYVVTVLDQRHILEYAAGQKAVSEYPSWTPDWRDPSIWRISSTAKDDCDRVQDWYKAIGLCCKEVWTIASGFDDTAIAWRYQAGCDGINFNNGIWEAKSFHELRAIMTAGNATNEQISIDSSTAALSIKLIRIIQLSSKPRRVLDFGSLRMFEFVVGQHSLLLCTNLIDLDLVLDDTPTWMFLQEGYGDYGPIVFFLREARQESGNTAFELIFSCRCWDLLVFRRPQQPGNGDVEMSEAQEDNKAQGDSTQNIPGGMIPMEHADGCNHHGESPKRPTYWELSAPYETLSAATSRIDCDANIEHELMIVFPDGKIRVKDTLPLFQLLADAGPRKEPLYLQFGELYVSIISQCLSVPCSMKSPCYIDYAHPEGHIFGSKPRGNRNIFLTVDAATWAKVQSQWQVRDRINPYEMVVNQQITKVIEADEDLSSFEIFEDRNSIDRTKIYDGHDVANPKGMWERHNGELRKWVGWNRLTSQFNEKQTAFLPEDGSVKKEATVCICIPISSIVRYMQRTDLAKRFYNLTKFRSVTGQDETTMAQYAEESYRNVFAHYWSESLKEEIGLIGEPCRTQIV
ncbi:hypothetical protein G7054_g9176 [Neopestalotiopsis clavispora]|nr:hypothetical protein G7054_g9176 [Neopestalotiopsis clavispora]